MSSWYLIYCKRGQLARAQQHLEQQRVATFCPMLELEKIAKGKRQVALEPLFPNYLFVQFDLNDIHTTTVKATRGVSHFIRFGQQLAQIPASIIEELMAQPVASQIHPNTPQSGDKVKIKEGIFKGLTAIYAEPDGETRSILLLNLLNQQVPKAMDNTQFSKI